MFIGFNWVVITDFRRISETDSDEARITIYTYDSFFKKILPQKNKWSQLSANIYPGFMRLYEPTI